MRLQGVEELVLVKLAAMMLVEPWSMDIKKMMDMMLGLGLGGAAGEKVGVGWGFAVRRDVGRGGECHI